MKQLFRLLLLFLSLSAFGTEGSDISAVAKHTTLSILSEAAPPRVWENHLLFTQKPGINTRMVGIAFAYEDYQKIHLFKRNKNNVFFLLLPLDKHMQALEYRIIVDGLWMEDPTNPKTIEDHWGTPISVFETPKTRTVLLESPVIEENWATFSFRGEPKKQVYIAGDFNQFDPFLTPMEETAPGVYQIRIKLIPGRHFYYYIYNGERLTDPLNMDHTFMETGQRLSILDI